MLLENTTPVKPKKGCDGRFTFVPRPMREADRSAEAGAVLSVPRGVAELARRGYPVFPLSAQTKQPAVEGGFYAATTDLDTLAARAQDRPSCDWAMATGVQSGVVVIDADTPTAARLMADAYGPPDAETRRGAHWYFRHPQDGKVTSTRGFLPDLDRKGDGGYVAVPPSANKTWNFGIPDRGALPILPADLRGGKRGTADASHGGTVNTDAADAIAAVMPAGGRHDLMLMLAGVMLRREAAANVTATLLKAWDQAGALSSAARADIWSICVSESSGTSEAAFAPSSESSSATVSSLSIDSNFTAGSS